MVFFEIVALHSCQLRIRLKHLVTTCDFNILCSKSVALQLAAIWKNKFIRCCFSRISVKKSHENTYFPELFVDCFRHNKRTTEGKLKCLLHTALISKAFFDESNDKRKRCSLKSVRSQGTKWKIQYLSKLETHLVSFIFRFEYQISGKNKNKRFRSMADFELVKSASAVLSV